MKKQKTISLPLEVAEPWALDAPELLQSFSVSPETGLEDNAVSARQDYFGLNQLREIKPRSLLLIFSNQLKSFVVFLLFAACLASFAFGEFIQGTAVLVVIVINTLIGFFTEWRAIRTMEALRKLGEVTTTVRRNGQVIQILAQAMVPGDIVLFEAGDVISADIRILTASNLQADESILTGESIPSRKSVEILDKSAHLSERSNILHKGTALTRGSGEGVVVGTGFNTQLGHVAKLVSSADSKHTPLEKKLASLGKQLVYFTLILVSLIAIVGILVGRETVMAIEIAVALAVAAIPEGLPIVATIALASGLRKMSKRHALINRLSAVETLGATSVIITDKTGTLTENRMTLSHIELNEQSLKLSGTGLDIKGQIQTTEGKEIQTTESLNELLEVLVLCNNASLYIQPTGEVEIIGDPTEVALLIAGAKYDLQRDALLQSTPELREESFSSETKAMATYHKQNNSDKLLVAVKGAPESIFEACTQVQSATGPIDFNQDIKNAWLKKADAMALQGLRLLAVAKKQVQDIDEKPYEKLILLAVVGLVDPPRPGVKKAITQCHTAGINVVMITGDHPATAFEIGKTLGITDAESDLSSVVDLRNWTDTKDLSSQSDLLQTQIFARATPQQKQQLIQLHQGKNRIVAMTGDGINDAPALKLADIGIAMGIRGTQVAKEASDMILLDDAFESIVIAIKQGRIIYNNIIKFVLYLLSCNLGEILIIAMSMIFNAPLPLLPLQILFLNLITDIFPALALGVSGASGNVLEHTPRKASSKLLHQKHWLIIFLYGLLMCLIVLGAMAISRKYLNYTNNEAVSIAFLTLAFTQLWHVFNLRDNTKEFFNNEIVRNHWVWRALLLCIVLILLAVYIPSLSIVLEIVAPTKAGWLLILFSSMSVLLFGPLINLSVKYFSTRNH